MSNLAMVPPELPLLADLCAAQQQGGFHLHKHRLWLLLIVLTRLAKVTGTEVVRDLRPQEVLQCMRVEFFFLFFSGHRATYFLIRKISRKKTHYFLPLYHQSSDFLRDSSICAHPFHSHPFTQWPVCSSPPLRTCHTNFILKLLLKKPSFPYVLLHFFIPPPRLLYYFFSR